MTRNKTSKEDKSEPEKIQIEVEKSDTEDKTPDLEEVNTDKFRAFLKMPEVIGFVNEEKKTKT